MYPVLLDCWRQAGRLLVKLRGCQVVLEVGRTMASCPQVATHAVEPQAPGHHHKEVEPHMQRNEHHSRVALHNHAAVAHSRAVVVHVQELEHRHQEVRSRVGASHILAVARSHALLEARNLASHNPAVARSPEVVAHNRKQAWASGRIPVHLVVFHVAAVHTAFHEVERHVVEHNEASREAEHHIAAPDNHAEEHRALAGRRSLQRQEERCRMLWHPRVGHQQLERLW